MNKIYNRMILTELVTLILFAIIPNAYTAVLLVGICSVILIRLLVIESKQPQ